MIREKLKAVYNWILGHKTAVYIAVFTLLLLLPLVIRQSYIISVAVRILMYAMLASSLNIVNGYSGQMNIGQAAFYAIGAYTSALLSTKAGISFWLLLIISGLVTALFGVIVSIPTRRLNGVYLALVTLGLAEIVRLIILNWNSFTYGPMGVKDIPRASFFGHTIKSATDFYYLGLALLAITFFCIERVIRSNIGRNWISIREDQTAAKFLGVHVNQMKTLAFAFSGFFAGVAGTYCAFYYQYISPDMFKTDESFSVLAMIIIGGQGTVIGPIIGSVVVNVLNELMRVATEYRLVAYGLLIIVMMWLRPAGIAGDASSFKAADIFRKKRPSRKRSRANGKEE